MSSDVTRSGIEGSRRGREALTGAVDERFRHNGTGADTTGTSYYGQPVIRRPGWSERDIVGYLFLGGLAGGSSLLAVAEQLTGVSSRRMRRVAAASSMVSLGLLVHDLGRPARFVNMLRVFKTTSPMNVGSWLLAGYAPATAVAAVGPHLPYLRHLVRPATWFAAALGSGMTAYTGVLLADTAVPAWHDGADELPFLFAGSGAMAAGGLGSVLAPSHEAGPARRLALVGAAIDLVAADRLRRSNPAHRRGSADTLHRVARLLTIGGSIGALAGRRRTAVRRLAGAALVIGSALTKLSVFRAGTISADDPAYVVGPQRRRLDAVTSSGASTADADGGVAGPP